MKKLFSLLAVLLVALAIPITTVVIRSRQTLNQQAVGPNSPSLNSLPDTSRNIHTGLVFDYNTDPSHENGVTDYVWGSQYGGNNQSVFQTFYIPFDREVDDRYNKKAHDLIWWQASHPDWIEYQCDKKTVAFYPGDPYSVPLDIANADFLKYRESTYIIPMMNFGYSG